MDDRFKRILIFGLPGSGKTTLAKALRKRLEKAGRPVELFNEERVKLAFNDFDSSEDGRLREAMRMAAFAHHSQARHSICDFTAPHASAQILINAHVMVWMDTIKESSQLETEVGFQKPLVYDFRVTEKNSKKWSQIIFDYIIGNTSNEVKRNI